MIEPTDEVERLLADIDAAEDDVEHYKGLIQARKRDAEVFKARLKRIIDKTGVEIRHRDPLKAARVDPLRSRAIVEVEALDRRFTPADLAEALGITDKPRAERILMVLAEMGIVTRQDRGWTTMDPDAAVVRDWVIETRVFSFADAMKALPVFEMELQEYLDDFRKRGMLRGSGGFYQYLEPEGGTPAREDKRPPERNPPAYTDARATGAPVRLVDHGKRAKQGSIPGQRHRLVMRDRRYEAQQAANAERAERQRRKSKGQ